MNPINLSRQINAAIVNVSGRQRMLTQRIACLALQWICATDSQQSAALQQDLHHSMDLMERSHLGLLHGDAQLNLPGSPSEAVLALYFEPPVQLHHLIYTYITNVRTLLLLPEEQRSIEHPLLQEILATANNDLLTALDCVVHQYEKESDIEQATIADQLVYLYQSSLSAAETAKQQAKQLEGILTDLHQTQTQLLQAEKMSGLGQLVAGIAHEINNPVNFIHGNLTHVSQYTKDLLALIELYERSSSTTEIQAHRDEIDFEFLKADLPEVLNSMYSGTDRVRQLVLSLRNFSRLDEAELKDVDLHEGLESTLLILRHRCKPVMRWPGIQIQRHYADLPEVTCNPGRINQVFMNLLSNALDALEEYGRQRPELYSEKSPPTITIHTAVQHDRVVIRICDNGPGIPESVQMRVFDPFFTTKPIGQGTGLGLSICYQIIDSHQGQLSCHSVLGQGTEFRIELPVMGSLIQPIMPDGLLSGGSTTLATKIPNHFPLAGSSWTSSTDMMENSAIVASSSQRNSPLHWERTNSLNIAS
ncbi:ATP-binding protein [Alkalinema pantanalense CENA528]|uniref:ATP-binding protein n=1 Tax=Alkalinema pantanalense TaxID=1620705 RepID=UPI003D6EA18C